MRRNRVLPLSLLVVFLAAAVLPVSCTSAPLDPNPEPERTVDE